MPDVQLIHCCPKEKARQFHDDPGISQALVPLVCMANDVAEVKKTDHETASGKNKTMVLGHPTKRRSCALVNTPSPCVNKAIYHIEALEAKMETWFQQYEHMIKEERTPWCSYVESTVHDDDDILKNSTKIHVVGVGLIEPDPGRTLLLKQETEDVVSEVIGLIWRLEADRLEAEEALKQERQRKKTLSLKIDGLSLWRLHHLGVSVQKEHEACARDISELQWHISCKKQQLDKAHEQAQKLEAVNAKLLEDIRFLEKHSPLLEEKLNVENEAMADIRKAQAEATITYNEAVREWQEAQMLLDKCNAEANNERTVMSEDLEARRNTLNKCIADLNRYEDLFDKSCVTVSESEKQLEEKEKLYEDLLVQKTVIEEKESIWKIKVEDLKYITDAQDIKNKQLSDEYEHLTEETITTKENCDADILALEKKFHNALHFLRELQYSNKELKIENEDFAKKIKDSTQMKLKCQAEIQRMQKNIAKNEEQFFKITAELAQILTVHEATKIKIEEMEDQAAKEEKRMKNLVEILRKQVSDETRASQLIQARNSSLLEELKDKQIESKKRRQELAKMVADIENPVAELEANVFGMRKSNTELTEKLSSILQRKQEIEERQTRIHDELGKTKSSLQLQLHDTQSKLSEVSNELNHTIKSSEQLQHEISELTRSKHVMQRVKENTEVAIEELKHDFESVHFKQQNAKDLSCHLKSRIEENQQKIKKANESHALQLDCRQKTLEKDQAALDASLIENKKLARKYKVLQRRHMDQKDDLLDQFEKRVTLEGSIRDRTQLSVLQRRMHRALLEYFKLRGLYGQAGLAKFQAASHENVQKILTVQEEMSKTIQHVSAFVNSLTDGSSTADCKANNQSISDAETKDKESHTVQKTV